MMMDEDNTNEERPDAALLRSGEHDNDYGRDRNEEGNENSSDGGGTDEEEEEEKSDDDDDDDEEEEEEDDDDNDNDNEEEEEEDEVDPSLCMMADVQYCDVFSALQDERIFDKFPIGDAAKTLDALLRLKLATPGESLIKTFLELHSEEDQDTKPNSQQDQRRGDEIIMATNEADNNNENKQPYIMNKVVEYTVIVDVCHLLGFRPDRPPPDPDEGFRQIKLSEAVAVLIKLLRCLGDIHGRTTASYTKQNLFDDFQLLMRMRPDKRQAVLDLFDQSLSKAGAQDAERKRIRGGEEEEEDESLICKTWPSKFISFCNDCGSGFGMRDFLSLAGILVGHYGGWGHHPSEDDDLVYGIDNNIDHEALGSMDERIVRIGRSNDNGESATWLPALHDCEDEYRYRWPCPSSFSNLTMLQELHLNGCTSLVPMPSLKKLYLKDAELDMMCLQDLCFPQLELLQIEPKADTRDKDVSCRLVSNDISPCLKHFTVRLKGRSLPEEDLIRCFASLTACVIPKTLIHFNLALDSVPRQALETLVVDLAPNLGDNCVIRVGVVETENICWLASKLKSAPTINIRYLIFDCRPRGSDNEINETWKAVEYISDKCNAILVPVGIGDFEEAPKSYQHKIFVRHAGNNLLDPNDIANINDKKNVPICVWPTILQRAGEKSNILSIFYRLFVGPAASRRVGDTDGDRVHRNFGLGAHSGLFHLLRYGPVLSHLSGDVRCKKKNKKEDRKIDSAIEDGGCDMTNQRR